MSHHLGLNTIKKAASTALTGDVTLSEGSGVILTQTGNDIAIAASGGGGGASALADLSDVDVSGVDSGDVLVYSSEGAWYPEPKPAGVVSSVVAGTGISVNNADPANPIVTSTGGVDSLNDVGDVTITTPITTDKYLRYDDSGEGFWANMALQVEDDASPALGGDLDLNGHSLGNADAADLTKLGSVTATATELNHLAGVTSSVQDQLDAKVDAADVIDEDDMSSDSATKIPTQQSVKAYVDANAGGGGGGTDWHIIAQGYESIDSMVSAHSGGSDGFVSSQYYQLTSGASAGNYAQVHKRLSTRFRPADISLPMQGGWVVVNSPSFSADGTAHLRFFSSSSTATTGTAQQVGIVQTFSGGATTVVATSTGDGTTEETATVSGFSIAQGQTARYAMKFDGTSVDFYVNGVLKNTHSTNIPLTTGSTARPYVSVARLTTDAAFAHSMILASFMLEMPLFS